MRFGLLLAFLLPFLAVTVYAAPAVNDAQATVEEQMRELRNQLDSIRSLIQKEQKEDDDSVQRRMVQWQPLKRGSDSDAAMSRRLAAWQPMRKSTDQQQALLAAIEWRLNDVLNAGERLGIEPEMVLRDLRQKNSLN